MEGLTARWLEVKRRIAGAAERSGREAGAVRVVAVTKTVPPGTIREALALGLTDLGENRVQECLKKQEALGRDCAAWHMIGSLQTNKAQRAAEAFALIHSLDRLELAEALARAGERLGRRIPVLVQVNVSGEASKHGIPPGELPGFLGRARSLAMLSLSGLMTMAPLASDPETARPVFRRLADLFAGMAERYDLGPDWRWLSMGMSQDYEVAVEEGANLVRIGTAIFGPQLGR
ncbi:MAG: YggS family pyridoxal phosphate-dependent enzyme [Patescibacteria group bacterium]